MIQDIAPHRLDNSFKHIEPSPEDIVFTFDKGKVLVCNDGADARLPEIDMLPGGFEKLRSKAIYAFSVDDKPMFMLLQSDIGEVTADGMEYINIRKLHKQPGEWRALAAVTASHLSNWYIEHRYCGRCGGETVHSDKERALVCSKCNQIQYPVIAPVIMAAVTDGDRLLVTRYAGRDYKGLALIAGFVEIGESIEAALAREVMEEVGLKVKDLRYFGSQPWGFSCSVISGFFASLDGSGDITMDENELSEAIWIPRSEIPEQKSDISITAAMIEAFRKGEI